MPLRRQALHKRDDKKKIISPKRRLTAEQDQGSGHDTYRKLAGVGIKAHMDFVDKVQRRRNVFLLYYLRVCVGRRWKKEGECQPAGPQAINLRKEGKEAGC